MSFSGGIFASLYVNVAAYPAVDTALVTQSGAFYLNLTSDGRVQWATYLGASLASTTSIALNRWVHVAAIAGGVGLALLVDGAQVAPGPGGPPTAPSTANVVVGYAEGLAHFIGSLDEVVVLSGASASSRTLLDFGTRGILPHPNGTDTDADGQELVVATAKTPKRYPTRDLAAADTEKLDLGLAAPAWALAKR